MLGEALGAFVLVSVRLYRDGIKDALVRDPRFELLGSASSLAAAVADLQSAACAPDVTLVDMRLPEGTAAARTLQARWPAMATVALAVSEADEEIVSWAEAGVAGLVSRDATLAEVLSAVEAAARRETLTSPVVAAALLRRVAAMAGERHARVGPALTRRELEVVQLIGCGQSNKEIAGALCIELSTVKNHVHSILEKLCVRHRAQAVSVALARGELVQLPAAESSPR
ncbi:MAG TPA: response regulator transcription factor [Solirubrobacteraceae bacterium]|nr:response regulator transcription factor [Solirubrobacteraceae bacterium]